MKKLSLVTLRLRVVSLAAICIAILCGCSNDEKELFDGYKSIEWRSSIEPVVNSENIPIRQIPAQGGEYDIEATNVPVVHVYQAEECKKLGSSSDKAVVYKSENKECTNIITSFAEINAEGHIVHIKIEANETGADRYLDVHAYGHSLTYLGSIVLMQKGGK